MTACTLVGCLNEAVVQWKRRPTADELAALVAAEQQRRSEVLLLADPDLPVPQFGPLPTVADTVVSVFGCVQHGISITLAPFVHQSICCAPAVANLPGCDCTPEPITQDLAVAPTPPPLPSGWS